MRILRHRNIFYASRSKSLLGISSHRDLATQGGTLPGERAFFNSELTYVLYKNRTKLDIEGSNQSIYIYMNQRTLRKSYEVGRSWATIAESDAVAVEDEINNLIEQREVFQDGQETPIDICPNHQYHQNHLRHLCNHQNHQNNLHHPPNQRPDASPISQIGKEPPPNATA